MLATAPPRLVRISDRVRTDGMKVNMDTFGMKIWMTGAVTTIAWMGPASGKSAMNSSWYEVNDGVMGGLSQSLAEYTDEGDLRFSGVVSFENNGGFASIRNNAGFLQLEGSDGIRLRVKGDGKKYQFRVRTSRQFDGVSYKNAFETVKGKWIVLKLKWSDFSATFRGRKVPNAPKLSPEAIEQIGFLIADKQEGAFELLVGEMEPAP